jgi:hypothetical protein
VDLVYDSSNQIAGSVHIITDITKLKTLIGERDETIKKLEDAFAQIKTLKGLLPICSHCKRIRNDKGYWEHLETYITEHSEALFSHGLCNKCLEKYYPEWADKIKQRKSD